MKKNIIFIILILAAITAFILYPRNVEQGVLIHNASGQASIYVNGKVKKFKSSINYPDFTVLSFKYNLITAFSFKDTAPIKDRIMIKDINEYDLELQGSAVVSKNAYYYEIDKSNNIKLADSSKLIVGKNNVKSFKDSKGQLRTFLIYPIDYTSMRVAISTTNFSSMFHQIAKINCSAPAKLYSLRDNLSLELPQNTAVTIDPSTNILKVSVSGKDYKLKNRVYLKSNSMDIVSLSRGIPSFTPSYTGILEFSSTPYGMCIINEVNLEDYLTKVVPSEMPLTGGIEALKCQAITARTYAISDMLLNRFADLGFYVDDSTQSQVYNNIQPQQLATDAVNSTKGMILTYNGNPIDAKYYSTSCGTGAPYSDIYFKSNGTSDSRPYLTMNNYLTPKQNLPKSEKSWLLFFKDTNIKAIDSDYPYFRWHVDFSSTGLTKSLNKSLKLLYEKRKDFITIKQGNKEVFSPLELKTLKDIKVIKRGDSGNVMELSFIFSNATVNIKGDGNIRSFLRCSSDFTGEATSIVRFKGDAINNAAFIPSSFFSIECNKDKFTFYGGGYGHGVGMSQYGAVALSKNGIKYQDILNTFYKSVKIENIY